MLIKITHMKLEVKQSKIFILAEQNYIILCRLDLISVQALEKFRKVLNFFNICNIHQVYLLIFL
jgi:hypothetical protein